MCTDFFTDVTMDAVRESIADAGVFYVAPDFDLWSPFCGVVAEEFVSRYSSLFNSSLLCWFVESHTRPIM